jgi:hypothetical protein
MEILEGFPREIIEKLLNDIANESGGEMIALSITVGCYHKEDNTSNVVSFTTTRTNIDAEEFLKEVMVSLGNQLEKLQNATRH